MEIIKVLIIDDNVSITSTLSKFLSFKKIKCTTVNDGLTGISMIKKKSFDVILLDLAMPYFTGYDVLKELKKEDMVKDQKIIVLTATTINKNKIKKLKQMGVFSVEKKPTKIQSLMELMVWFWN